MLHVFCAILAGVCAVFHVGVAAIIADEMRRMPPARQRAARKTVIVCLLAAFTQAVAFSIITPGAFR